MLRDPLKLKALQKGLAQLCEEGATQLFKPLQSNDLILGAVGPLQFEVASYRLRDEYGVDCEFEAVNVIAARWIHAAEAAQIDEFSETTRDNLARDHSGALVYLAPTLRELESHARALAEDRVSRNAGAARDWRRRDRRVAGCRVQEQIAATAGTAATRATQREAQRRDAAPSASGS